MRKHKEIQAQLAKLSKEEEKSETDSSVIEVETAGQEARVSQLHVSLLGEESQVTEDSLDTSVQSVVSLNTERNRADSSVISVHQDQAPDSSGNQVSLTKLSTLNISSTHTLVIG